MGERSQQVVEHLDAALKAAEAANMSTSETIGMFFYYAHNLAQQARETAVDKAAAEQEGSLPADRPATRP